MDTALSTYELKLQEANPLYADATHEGKKLSQQESAFIYYYLQTGNATQAFLKAGFTFPRRKRTKEERETGVDDITRTESYNELYRQNDLHHGSAEKRKEEVLAILNKEYNLIEEETKHNMVNDILEEENDSRNVLEEDYDKHYLLKVSHSASHLLHMPAVKKEIARRTELIRDAQVADEHEVFAYFTAVMRGQVLDQFGLEASLQERTRAAECLAKRLIDIPKKLQVSGTVGNQPVNLIIEERSEEEDIIDGEFVEE
jgi:phage terminase small subunit